MTTGQLACYKTGQIKNSQHHSNDHGQVYGVERVLHQRPQAVRCKRWLCRRLKMIFPSRENQNSRMTLQRARDYFGTLNPETNTVVLDGR